MILLSEISHIAASVGQSFPGLPPLAEYGILGIVAVVLTRVVVAIGQGKWYVPKYVLDAEKARADRYEAEIARLNTMIIERHVPALDDARHGLLQATELMHDLAVQRRGDTTP